MRRYLLVFAWACLGAGYAVETSYTISGVVIADVTDKPLKHVMVTISSVGGAPWQSSRVTGEDGRFSFANVAAGKFSLMAQRAGSTPQSFHENEGYSTAIVTGPGINSENIRFRLTSSGSISGLVEDDQGDPIPNAHVVLFHRGVFSGKLGTSVEGQQESDSSGAFYFGQLTLGTYLIAVAAQPWYVQDLPPLAPISMAPEFDIAYPITYYGSVTDPKSASPIVVTEGTASRVEIMLRAVPAAHVKVIKPEGKAEDTAINVYAIGPGGAVVTANARFLGLQNSEQLVAIAPGRYVFESESKGRKMVDIGGDATINLDDAARAFISGRLAFEGAAASGARILLSGANGTVAANFAQGGTFFTLDDVAPGRYQIELGNAPSYYVKSVVAGDRMAADGQLEVSDGAAVHVSILAAKGASALDGIAMKEGAPFAGAMVLLMPEDLSRTMLIRRDQSDSDGTFTFPEVAPGRYTLLAINDGRDLEYAKPSVIEPYLQGARTIQAPVSGNAQIKASVVGRQR